MVHRDELERYLRDLYSYGDFDDYCENGIQVEGGHRIDKIVFGVSFNLHLLNRAIEKKADAIIVHHGIFDKGFFVLKGRRKQIVKILLDNNISLFGIHLPMDFHPQLGHNALLLSIIEAGNVQPFEVGYSGENIREFSLDDILDIYYNTLKPITSGPAEPGDSYFSLSRQRGFDVVKNGPTIPKKIAVITGGSSSLYEKAIDQGIDTFVSGEIKEKIPALSYETRTNFINLGHYYSEKPGVLALQERIEDNFQVETEYIEIPNRI